MQLRDDFLMRSIERLVELIVRALKLGNPTRGVDLLKQGCGQTLGMEFDVLAMLDARSALDLLERPERAAAFVRLLRALSELQRQAGDELAATRHELHARELEAECACRGWRVTTPNQVSDT